jgi:translation elongation factor EF-4
MNAPAIVCGTESLSVCHKRRSSMRLSLMAWGGHDYMLNLVDTPGHVDF